MVVMAGSPGRSEKRILPAEGREERHGPLIGVDMGSHRTPEFLQVAPAAALGAWPCIARSIASWKSRASAKRSSGFLASAFATTASNDGDTRGSIELGAGTCAFSTR